MLNEYRIRKAIELLAELKQTEGALRKGDCYCFLGVLCETYRRVTGEGAWLRDPYSKDLYDFVVKGMRYGQDLPPVVQEWFGFEGTDPLLPDGEGEYYQATELNDSYEVTFPSFIEILEDLLKFPEG